MNTYL